MKPLPSRPDLDQLKKQAKELLAEYRRGTSHAVGRFRASLPAVAGLDDDAIAQLGLRLRDAQSCVAREYGFLSWAELKGFVEVVRWRDADPDALARAFCDLVYSGDITGTMNRTRPEAAARLLSDRPQLGALNPWIACATGDTAAVRRHLEVDPAWINRPGGPLALPPLVAATHSSLLRITTYRDRIHETVDVLLAAGADPDQSVASRWPPASLSAPSQDHRLSALYGAAGQNHDPELTRRLLTAGADPNDNESLYHSLESPECTKLLLSAGAVVTGTNALFRCLDLDTIATFRSLLAHADNAPELSDGRLLFWAIRRRRSAAHVAAILAAGVVPAAKTQKGVSAYAQALHYGLEDVADVLRNAGATADIGDDDMFIAACARGDFDEARRIKAHRPDLPQGLSEGQQRLLPELAAAGCTAAVRTMIELGWPIAVRGGDWNGSALNHAVFRGDAEMTRFLLEHGASWTEQHGFGDNVCGTLSWASINEPVEGGDWVACAQALVASGMPMATRNSADPASVLVDGKRRQFSEDVTEFLLGESGAS